MDTKKYGAVAVVLALWGQASLAQFGGGAMGGGMGAGPPSRGGGPGGGARPDDKAAPAMSPLEQTLDKLAELRARLLIAPEQAPAWESFQARVLDLAAALSRGHSVSAAQTALQTMQQRLSAAQNRYALMEDISDALKKLYAVLTPEQQKTADQWLPQAVPGLEADAAPRGGSGRNEGRPR